MPRRKTQMSMPRSPFFGIRGRNLPRSQWRASKSVRRTGTYLGRPAGKLRRTKRR